MQNSETETNESGAPETESPTANSPTTSQTNGNSSSRTLNTQEQLKATNEALNDFERQSGLGVYDLKMEIQNEGDRLLSLTPDEVRRMSAAECAEAAYTLEQYAFHVQRAINRQQSQANWAEARVTRIIAPTIHTMPAYTPGERRPQAIHLNDAAKQTERVRLSAQLKVDRIAYLTSRIASLAQKMSDLSFVKRVRQ